MSEEYDKRCTRDTFGPACNCVGCVAMRNIKPKPERDYKMAYEESLKHLKIVGGTLTKAEAEVSALHTEIDDCHIRMIEMQPRLENYNELLMAVQMKHPDETRHQTALRYIARAEKGSGVQTGSAETGDSI